MRQRTCRIDGEDDAHPASQATATVLVVGDGAARRPRGRGRGSHHAQGRGQREAHGTKATWAEGAAKGYCSASPPGSPHPWSPWRLTRRSPRLDLGLLQRRMSMAMHQPRPARTTMEDASSGLGCPRARSLGGDVAGGEDAAGRPNGSASPFASWPRERREDSRLHFGPLLARSRRRRDGGRISGRSSRRRPVRWILEENIDDDRLWRLGFQREEWERGCEIGGGRKRLLPNLASSLSVRPWQGKDPPAPYPATHGEPPRPSSAQARGRK
jgi:hypothetical protein